MSDKEYVEKVLNWRSDDFGHDTDALLRAESEALQKVGEMYLELRAERDKLLAEREQYKTLYNAASARVDDYCDLLKKVQSHSPISPSGDLVYDKLQSENQRLRAELDDLYFGFVSSKLYDALQSENKRLRDALKKISKDDYVYMSPGLCKKIAEEALK